MDPRALEKQEPQPQAGPQQRERQAPDRAQPQRMLYIQMEFCPRTLRDDLDQGGLSEEQAWQVLTFLKASDPQLSTSDRWREADSCVALGLGRGRSKPPPVMHMLPSHHTTRR